MWRFRGKQPDPALTCMRNGARIVFVGSRGHLGAWGGVHLMAAGAALVAMMRSMAMELAQEGIRVNMVAADFAHDRGDTPTLRAAISHAVEFLCAAELGISGETLLIDGNASLRMGEARDRRPPSSGTVQNHPPGPAGHPPT
jgi:NAD(P)-dependent dehydrogenase (short-subunit alcohol dehydrogenase family)